jgi:hypothetical protein
MWAEIQIYMNTKFNFIKVLSKEVIARERLSASFILVRIVVRYSEGNCGHNTTCKTVEEMSG